MLAISGKITYEYDNAYQPAKNRGVGNGVRIEAIEEEYECEYSGENKQQYHKSQPASYV